MKKIILIFLNLFICVAYSQENSLSGTVIYSEDSYPFPGVNITLINNGAVVTTTQSDMNGDFKISNIESGKYELVLTYISMKEKILSDILITNDTNLNQIVFPEPCVTTNGICPHNHTNNIVSIKYGLPSTKMLKRAEKGKIKLGGCVPSCENWHCKTHNIDF